MWCSILLKWGLINCKHKRLQTSSVHNNTIIIQWMCLYLTNLWQYSNLGSDQRSCHAINHLQLLLAAGRLFCQFGLKCSSWTERIVEEFWAALCSVCWSILQSDCTFWLLSSETVFLLLWQKTSRRKTSAHTQTCTQLWCFNSINTSPGPGVKG